MYQLHDLSPFFEDVLLRIHLALMAYTSADRGTAETIHVSAELELTRISLQLDALPPQCSQGYRKQLSSLRNRVEDLSRHRRNPPVNPISGM